MSETTALRTALEIIRQHAATMSKTLDVHHSGWFQTVEGIASDALAKTGCAHYQITRRGEKRWALERTDVPQFLGLFPTQREAQAATLEALKKHHRATYSIQGKNGRWY